MLRQDPDVVFIGEIRDEETARIGVQAALTGHLVLSSLHTNDAPGAVPRLRDLGCPAFAINAALLCVVAQRLVRRVCADCAAACVPDALTLARFGVSGEHAGWVRGSGCARCAGTGMRGRVGLYELLELTGEVKSVIERTGTTDEIAAAGASSGMRPMWMDGLDKARIGMTTLEEVARTVAVLATESGEGESRPDASLRRTA
jgi:type II secretory ATPase GspE/PulE/Tfp pilus assembly ATPase PilB-like protein